ncbi:MAG: hypothetical protein J6O88_10240 [Chryseobacterium sp.]|uniref:hypothetical protein n=1 Tax=Chryseobacterium sp. TaxID=1871047 RepID=UPI001B02F636|nr:hypothetical protein [Chryseobacterium sp.]MBO6185046.1 hypothetical protein [Chryseobacterium sp.]
MNQELISEGKCVFCEELLEKSKINTHLKKHLKDFLKQEPLGTSFLLQIFTYPNYKKSPYFIYLLVDGEAKMKDIDGFLKDIWLDCCGHMSEFEGRIAKSRKLVDILEKGMDVGYEYDFGSTTYLQIKVVEEFSYKSPKKIYLLSRNEPLKLMCHTCKEQPASVMCSVEQWEDQEHMFCDECATKHEEVCEDFADYAALPIVNSPRMGECGYEGGYIDKERDGIFVM